jgi:pimeloyl-ACP methyl ester carboxylesterase
VTGPSTVPPAGAGRVVFVHGACVRDGAWWWHRAAAELAADGIASSAPALPSCGETGRRPGAGGPSLADDVAAVRAHLQAEPGPVLVVAHSYGGMVVAEAAAGLPHVRHLLAIASFLPAPGESLASFGDGTPAPYLDVGEDGTVRARAELATATFLHDCLPEDVAPARARLVRQTVAATAEPVRVSAWQEVPSTYLVCGLDRGTPPELQRAQGRRASRTVEVAAGHHVFLSQPRVVADLVREGLGLTSAGAPPG